MRSLILLSLLFLSSFSFGMTYVEQHYVRGDIYVLDGNSIIFRESDSNGSNYVELKAPSNLSANTTYTLPSSDGSDGQVLGTDGSGVLSWKSPAAGSKSYIDIISANVETSIGSWETDDGAGSAANYLTLSVESSAPLAGVGSLKIAKSANDASSEYVKLTTQTIDLTDRGGPLYGSISFDADHASYAAGDLILEIYDNTNAAVLYSGVSADLEIPSTTGKFNFVTYTESTTASIEVRLKINSTNASAYDVYIDEVKLGPAAQIQAPVVTEWQDFTPTGSWSTNTSYSGKYRRVGDSAEYFIRVSTSGAPTSATLTVNLYSGHVIDTTKIEGTDFGTVLGQATVKDGVSAGYDSIVNYNDTTSVTPRVQASGSPTTFTAITQTTPITFGSGDSVTLSFKVPIVGWGAGALVNDNELSLQTILVIGAGSGTTAITADTTDIPFTEVEDKQGVWNGTQFTVPKTGKYSISGIVAFGANPGGSEAVFLYKDGSSFKMAGYVESNQQFHPFQWEGDLNKDEVMSLRVTRGATLQGSTSNHWIKIESKPDFTTLGVIKGPAIHVSGEGNGAGSIGTGTNIDFTETDDTHDAWNGTQFTMPKTGYFIIKGNVQLSATSTLELLAYIDGSSEHTANYNLTSQAYHPFAWQGKLNKNEVWSLRPTATKTLANGTNYHWIDILCY